MATADSVKTKLQGLLQSANAATGNNDSTLSEAVASLVAGFGSGAKLYTGIHKMEERAVENVVFDTPGGVSYFAFFMIEMPSTGTGYALFTSLLACKSTKRVICSASNSSGSAVTASQHYITGTPTVSTYPGVSFGDNQVTLLAPKTTDTTSRWLQLNKQYVWIGW